MPSTRTPIGGPAAWTGASLTASGRWLRRLDDGHRAEIAAALAQVKVAGLPNCSFGKADFPLDRTAALLADITDELENGCGVMRLQGLDVGRYTMDELRMVWWGLGSHLGVALYQNARGELIGEVRDETRDASKSYTEPQDGTVMSSRARARSNGPLRFHTDRCDAIALLCASNSAQGGNSKIASAVTIHDTMLARRPDLLDALFTPYWRKRAEDEEGATKERYVVMPVFGMADGKFTTQYSRTFVEQAQEDPAVPRLTAAQHEALDMLAAVAEETCLVAPFEAGDIQILNNHVAYHGRTAYEDGQGERTRNLLRLWLATPHSRRLPDGFETYWGHTAPGVVRGGVVQADGRRAHAAVTTGQKVPVPA